MKSFFRNLTIRHDRLKTYIHEGWRYPLPPWGRAVMGVFYFSIPVVGGYYVMQWAISKSHKSIGPRGELLRHKEIEGIGDLRKNDNGDYELVGGMKGLGGGVKLAVSDDKTQVQNKKMLETFFKKERKKRQKQQVKEQQQQQQQNSS
jgi:hypothetical protein